MRRCADVAQLGVHKKYITSPEDQLVRSPGTILVVDAAQFLHDALPPRDRLHLPLVSFHAEVHQFQHHVKGFFRRLSFGLSISFRFRTLIWIRFWWRLFWLCFWILLVLRPILLWATFFPSFLPVPGPILLWNDYERLVGLWTRPPGDDLSGLLTRPPWKALSGQLTRPPWKILFGPWAHPPWASDLWFHLSFAIPPCRSIASFSQGIYRLAVWNTSLPFPPSVEPSNEESLIVTTSYNMRQMEQLLLHLDLNSHLIPCPCIHI